MLSIVGVFQKVIHLYNQHPSPERNTVITLSCIPPNAPSEVTLILHYIPIHVLELNINEIILHVLSCI